MVVCICKFIYHFFLYMFLMHMQVGFTILKYQSRAFHHLLAENCPYVHSHVLRSSSVKENAYVFGTAFVGQTSEHHI